MLFMPDSPRSDLGTICARWTRSSTVLVLATVGGGAVLVGPDARIPGHLGGETEQRGNTGPNESVGRW